MPVNVMSVLKGLNGLIWGERQDRSACLDSDERLNKAGFKPNHSL